MWLGRVGEFAYLAGPTDSDLYKPALRRYWTRALQRIPDLRFVLQGVYEGIDIVVITYRNQNDRLVNEVLKFNDDKVIEGRGTYLVPT